ncbi:MAG: hypothetical protein GY794_07355 [bacterium]|nr:hypothetical protein [bacterium]
MTRKWIPIVIILMMLAVSSAFLPADDKSVLKAISTPGVIFDKWGYKLKLTRLDSECDINLGKGAKKPPTYSLTIKGSCKIPQDVDGVLMTPDMKVLKALNASGKDLRLPPKKKSGKSAPKYRSGTFGPILWIKKDMHVAEVEISKLALTANPYTLEKLKTELVILTAVDRVERTIPAVVSQDLRELTEGLKARVSAMRISSKRELTVEMTDLRIAAGPVGAFIESITALDADKKTIGQARIIEGDPLSQKGKVTASFLLTGSTDPASLIIRIVTKSKTRKIPFEITGIFQK